MVYALDPDRKGAILWQVRVGQGGTAGGVQWGMASDGQPPRLLRKSWVGRV